MTGASHGIGRAVAEAFAGEGASVILHAHPLNTDGLGKVRTRSARRTLAAALGAWRAVCCCYQTMHLGVLHGALVPTACEALKRGRLRFYSKDVVLKTE